MHAVVGRDDIPRLPPPNNRPHILNPVPVPASAATPAHPHLPPLPLPSMPPPAYSLMVAGHRAGKTAFLRLLLDTSVVADSATPDQLSSVAKFVQGAAGPTTRIRSASLDISLDSPQDPPITLNLVDTPALDTRDGKRADAILEDIIQYVEARYAESLDPDHSARLGDPHVHLCLYFLDPDAVVPPSTPTPPAPLVSRARTNSVSHAADLEPVILEPPVSTSPRPMRHMLPASEVEAIRVLSTRCNVLPVVARADTITTERLAAIKYAVRHDLAESGIGFGIFDVDGAQAADPNGSAAAAAASSGSLPTSPGPQMYKLPYALVAPDCYSHSDGVPRHPQSRHDLVHQYSPPPSPSRPLSRLVLNKFVRSYRWGTLDVLNHTHCDFMPLRHAVFLHMDALQKYTRDYLFSKFVDERAPGARSRPQAAYPSAHNNPPPLPSSAAPPPPQAGHPIPTAIDALYPSVTRPAAQHHQISGGDPPSSGHPRASSPLSDPAQVIVQAASSSSKSSRQRAKKITIACNFCRSRKLKCDGQRPACHQCQKRSHACDYQVPAKRRGGRTRRAPGGTGSESEDGASADEGSLEPSMSPEVKPSEHLGPPPPPASSRLSLPTFADAVSNALPSLPKSEPILPTMLERRPGPPLEHAPPTQHQHPHQQHPSQQQQPPHSHRPFLPPLAPPHSHHPHSHPHPLPHPGAHDHASAATPLLPPIRGSADADPAIGSTSGPAPETPQQQQQLTNGTNGASAGAQNQTPRKRSGTNASAKGGGGASNRAASHYGPKVVACNHCRARKTKCDGLHPTCSSCARRSLPCNYVNDPNGPSRRRTSQAASEAQSSASSNPPSARENDPPENQQQQQQHHQQQQQQQQQQHQQLKRELADEEAQQDAAAAKRMRVGVGDSGPSRTVAVLGAP